ncbi:hypothetical protein [Blastomonas fulva]|uniref:hypothetical protein n=1 Tax=Blastomonas fulva TaxID=1550728 RepID=UPI0025A41CC2|nr:hypothetical protein [Blastomonas fulva]MDM7927539.1 hypothetical protein [Blastomonas fulva]MDM7964979.1 hypothetical protein [Blastomonas fulva]
MLDAPVREVCIQITGPMRSIAALQLCRKMGRFSNDPSLQGGARLPSRLPRRDVAIDRRSMGFAIRISEVGFDRDNCCVAVMVAINHGRGNVLDSCRGKVTKGFPFQWIEVCWGVTTERDAAHIAGLLASRSESTIGATFAALILTDCDRQSLKSAPREEC